MERTTLHIVGGDSRSRAEQARITLGLGHHAEIYADLDELVDSSPQRGIVIAASEGEASKAIRHLRASGIWLPVVITAPEPAIDEVVAAIKAGALDFLSLPLEIGGFARRLSAIIAEASKYIQTYRRQVDQQGAISLLSRREREVLELLCAGCSNKEIARNLGISARTVEIHRGNMMSKLGARRAADAVRLWLQAGAFGTVAPSHNMHFALGRQLEEKWSQS